MANREILLQLSPKQLCEIKFTKNAITVRQTGLTPLRTPSFSRRKSSFDIPLSHVLGAKFDEKRRLLEIPYVGRRRTSGPHSLLTIRGEVKDIENAAVDVWVDALTHTIMISAYDVERHVQFLFMQNPSVDILSKGHAVSIYHKQVEPIFRAGGCIVDLEVTKHRGHAFEIAKNLALKYDAIVTVSGDGLVHEVLNGFAHHLLPSVAFSIPIAPVPAGSGNGLAVNLLGRQDGLDVAIAALNAVKGSSSLMGRPMSVDLFSFVQGDKRTISFMSQALGLMADLDLGTESMRWMGGTRFFVGALRGIAKWKPCPVRLSYKAAEVDKKKMVEALKARYAQIEVEKTSSSANGKLVKPRSSMMLRPAGEILPPLQYVTDEEGWTTFEQPMLYVYAGKGPYVSHDMMPWPVSLPDDGLIDIAVHVASSRGDALASLAAGETGDIFWKKSVHYVKAHAYRVKPLNKAKGFLSVDGESFPYEDFQVEVHKGLGTFLSTHGTYVADFASKST
ncbi:hypothetical protein FISHEDRAFT_53553 [Fistulina hepatica ATCC 64428]|nr:hypothetical protein FISHEDRAFT_53553 [Fistulina hepatica ATCC 64428]